MPSTDQLFWYVTRNMKTWILFVCLCVCVCKYEGDRESLIPLVRIQSVIFHQQYSDSLSLCLSPSVSLSHTHTYTVLTLNLPITVPFFTLIWTHCRVS